ncbi:bifunctional cobalt-precorrin-7 (C(5))-methyltransferase/cobalt-precorrin-6B (C(15))-methyltransferase [Paraburkholderia tropica]|uniref:bifunctional cobalt-precorrin-7 (C(5))-methyltransferase/cobalt-precorrin-6B (C(15))-methyltransferase n=1 Tax=Paraburkholderia tropica TaxID=92647 RepID=UPI0007EC4E46|nr:bifunctional cobalt-precorrin-7 (C(5))-methyltransferase/cobalt-precorrin-6B (C(15))-methyltransferase [Paraburkholderia tropica]MBB2982143.1 precorrin-6Y C5,15-methyltransferase (decarboxylating) [Paraburkholderia tropica]MBB3003105.1 precorrin-6Y C5,15-methyltransferase (decarboxylating) [Paraburkholderia tropica]MBB6322042.1 precorrin-6Y C5,15-methyltransferase (decarboxylating) [Paraburkholderia tropica]OBR52287.1 precorrin-6Y C5,15-methyltransferase [Paraburkholderia tropica]
MQGRRAWLTVIGIGDDGYAGLGRAARRALFEADVVTGGERHLAMLPARVGARREAWPQPFSVAPLLALRESSQSQSRVCVLASGDPMCFGVGATLARHVPIGEMAVLPAPSSLSLAAARLGWALQDVAAVSLVGRPLDALRRHLFARSRVLALSADGRTPAALAALLAAQGFGATRLSVFEHLGGALERRIEGRADAWQVDECAALNLVAFECEADDARRAEAWTLTPGLPDDAFRHDGQLTKRDVRALTLARLAPTPGTLLWDVGAGSGSIGIEWMRAHPACRAIAIEANAQRQRFIEHNRNALGVPALQLVAGRAPDALAGLAAPDAVFIGGGVTVPGVLDACWERLAPGGRLVANAVTVQSEAALVAWRAQHGGTLTRIGIGEAEPLGRFDTWRQALPVTLYDVRKP